MSDKKTSDDEFFEERFDEEFDFKESDTPEMSPKTRTSLHSNKWVAASASFLVILFIGYFGYRFWHKSTEHTSSLGLSTNKVVSKPAPTLLVQSTPKSNTQTPLKPEQNTKNVKKMDSNGFSEAEITALMKAPSGESQTNTPQPPVTPSPTPFPHKPTQEDALSEHSKAVLFNTAPPQSLVIPLPKEPDNLQKSADTMNRREIVKGTENTLSDPKSIASAEMEKLNQHLNSTLDTMKRANQQMDNNLNQIKYLDAYTREVSLTVEKLSAQISTMDNRIVALTNLANSLSKDLSKVRNEIGYAKRVAGDENLELPPPPKRSRAGTEYSMGIEEGLDYDTGRGGYRKPRSVSPGITPDEPEFVVHAVIPGRAWLKSSKGQIITLTEGETIGNYGKVLVIDAANGVVLTSSGITFR